LQRFFMPVNGNMVEQGHRTGIVDESFETYAAVSYGCSRAPDIIEGSKVEAVWRYD
jgi:hypothetical protein